MYKKFEKWHGCKNDFIIIYITDNESEILKKCIKNAATSLCSKSGSGIGADGVLLLQTKLPQDPLPYKLTIINSDGSTAKNCGNGLRVAALSARARAMTIAPAHNAPELVSLEVEGQTFSCRFSTSGSKKFPYVNVDMGMARCNEALDWHTLTQQRIKEIAESLNISFEASDVFSCEFGNPHIVWKTDEASRDLLLKVGPRVQDFFSGEGVNIHLVKEVGITSDDWSQSVTHTGKKISEKYDMFCYERGAGETPACGSGATAVAANSLESGFLSSDEWAAVNMPGGLVYISKDSASNHYTLCGPGAFVFAGEVEI